MKKERKITLEREIRPRENKLEKISLKNTSIEVFMAVIVRLWSSAL
jgi:hypothetical protein